MQSSSPILHTVIFTVFVPGTVAGLMPWCRRGARLPASGVDFWIGVLTFTLGLAIYLHTAFWGFAVHGRGTPAPIAPTRKLVTQGLHNYVRNPMYVGVLLMILGQSVLFRSRALAAYLVVVWIIVHLFVLFYEEPRLQKQFGEEYTAYKKRVSRWWPRL